MHLETEPGGNDLLGRLQGPGESQGDHMAKVLDALDHSPGLLAVVLRLMPDKEFERHCTTVNEVLTRMTAEERVQYTKLAGTLAQWPVERVEEFVRQACSNDQQAKLF